MMIRFCKKKELNTINMTQKLLSIIVIALLFWNCTTEDKKNLKLDLSGNWQFAMDTA